MMWRNNLLLKIITCFFAVTLLQFSCQYWWFSSIQKAKNSQVFCNMQYVPLLRYNTLYCLFDVVFVQNTVSMHGTSNVLGQFSNKAYATEEGSSYHHKLPSAKTTGLNSWLKRPQEMWKKVIKCLFNLKQKILIFMKVGESFKRTKSYLRNKSLSDLHAKHFSSDKQFLLCLHIHNLFHWNGWYDNLIFNNNSRFPHMKLLCLTSYKVSW